MRNSGLVRGRINEQHRRFIGRGKEHDSRNEGLELQVPTALQRLGKPSPFHVQQPRVTGRLVRLRKPRCADLGSRRTLVLAPQA